MIKILLGTIIGYFKISNKTSFCSFVTLILLYYLNKPAYLIKIWFMFILLISYNHGHP